MDIDKLLVTRPSIPPLDEFNPMLEEIWENRWLTNDGPFLKRFENELSRFLRVKNISVVSNGTLALLLAIKSLGVQGEIITTPYTFVATIGAIQWAGCTPVFCDIKRENFNIDTSKIEELITEHTIAILPVHVYGNPCDNIEIDRIAKKHSLSVVYDAAHAFNVKKNGQSILNYGDMSILSLHATKVFNTVEGGSVICNSKNKKLQIDRLRDFGFNETNDIVDVGINAKMNEILAAYGLLQLDNIENIIKKRKEAFNYYFKKLKLVNGIVMPFIDKTVEYNYSYFPIRICESFPVSRDEVADNMNKHNIYPRKYFYPLVSDMAPYKKFRHDNTKLAEAKLAAKEIICLPLYENISTEDQNRVINTIVNIDG